MNDGDKYVAKEFELDDEEDGEGGFEESKPHMNAVALAVGLLKFNPKTGKLEEDVEGARK